MTPPPLRPYQEECLRDLSDYWDKGKGKSPIIILPTGAGKSRVIASFIERTMKDYPYVRIMICVHSRELVQQNYEELLENYPEADAGIYAAGLNSRDLKSKIIFASIQSVYNKVFLFPKIDIVIVDEAHSIPPEADTRYGKFLKDLYIANPNAVVWGCTATPFRTSSGLLTSGKNRIFDGIAHNTELKTLIELGYLVPVISRGGIKKIDLKDVHIRAGDFAQNEMAVAASDPLLVELAVKEIVEYGKERKKWLIYCSGVDHAEIVAKEIRKHGVKCEVITGTTPLDQRDKIINDFKNGNLKCICNVGVLTTGFNCPGTDMICLLYSTMSPGKYIQCVGRGCRVSPSTGKENCLLLDYGGNVERLGLLDEINPIKTKDVFKCDVKLPPKKECPTCHVIFHARIMKCPGCGYDFPIPEASAKHGVESYSGPITSDQVEPFLVDVTDTWVSKHSKPGKTPSVKFEFYDKMDRSYPMWLCLDHQGYAREKALALVRQMGGKANTVEEALKEWPQWKKVERIQAKQEGKFVRVTGFQFKPNQSQQQKLGEEE